MLPRHSRPRYTEDPDYSAISVNLTTFDLDRLDKLIKMGVVFNRTEAFRYSLSQFLDDKYKLLNSTKIPLIKKYDT